MMREPPFSLLPKPVPRELKGGRVLVLGLGDTGLSVANWVAHEGGTARVADSRSSPPRKKDFVGDLHTGPFQNDLLQAVDLVCISPGLSIDDPLIQAAIQKHIPVVGDIELFAWHVRSRTSSKVIAVTGTNGKTTVTSLTGHLLRAAGVDCEVAGNIGPAALAALLRRVKNAPAVWVLELSSYQLETTWSLAPDAATILNLSEDHLDRYSSLAEYGAAKARVLMGNGLQILNRDDCPSMALAAPGRKIVSFGLDAPANDEDFGVLNGRLVRGRQAFFEIAALPIHGLHNVANALAACALAHAAGLPLDRLGAGLRSFQGLPHRVELVASRGGVDWYDDSKGTNVGATVAALKGLGRKAVLIAGGEGKGQDFSPLADVVRGFSKMVLLIGRDASLIEKALRGLPTEKCATLEDAVLRAAQLAKPGEAVLLSPACASFDMFRDYKHRGEVFAAAVRRLGAAKGARP
jgi:UDP-N-acetylmuramoylalanine--D-glutamate ligase